MKHHVVDRQSEFYGLGRAIQNAGVAMPAFLRVSHDGSLSFGVREYVHGAYRRAHAAMRTFFGMNNRGHNVLLAIFNP